MLANAAFEPRLMVAECHTDHPAGRWAYVVALHTAATDEEVEGTIPVAELGESTPTAEETVVWDWRAGSASLLDGDPSVRLPREGWTYLVLAPVRRGIAVVGDVSKLVPAGDARIEVAEAGDGVDVVVKGAGEAVTITGWARTAPTADGAPVDHDAATGVWTATVEVPSRGWQRVSLRP